MIETEQFPLNTGSRMALRSSPLNPLGWTGLNISKQADVFRLFIHAGELRVIQEVCAASGKQ